MLLGGHTLASTPLGGARELRKLSMSLSAKTTAVPAINVFVEKTFQLFLTATPSIIKGFANKSLFAQCSISANSNVAIGKLIAFPIALPLAINKNVWVGLNTLFSADSNSNAHIGINRTAIAIPTISIARDVVFSLFARAKATCNSFKTVSKTFETAIAIGSTLVKVISLGLLATPKTKASITKAISKPRLASLKSRPTINRLVSVYRKAQTTLEPIISKNFHWLLSAIASVSVSPSLANTMQYVKTFSVTQSMTSFRSISIHKTLQKNLKLILTFNRHWPVALSVTSVIKAYNLYSFGQRLVDIARRILAPPIH